MICENCGKEHDGIYGSGRFCSEKCARSFSTKNQTNKLKEAKCTICGKNFLISKNASLNSCKCEDCKKENKKYKCKICGEFDCKNEFCKTHTVKSLKNLIIFNFDFNKIGTIDVFNEINKVRELLVSLYIENELSTIDIAKIYNISINQVIRALNICGIKLKNKSDALISAVKNNKLDLNRISNLYKTEWHTTWDNRKVYLRSSYESDFANNLDKNMIFYEVEALKIPYFDSSSNKIRIAIPDFYIPSTNTIYEIKSSYTFDEQNMKDKFKEYRKLGYTAILNLEHKNIEF